METATRLLDNLLALTLDAAPWLLFGLLIAGLIKAWAPSEGMAKLMGGRGLGSILMGALIGAPLPICSCGVLPAAIGLRRSGASREATTAFLVSTPETGVDSVALSYGMLGPFMAAVRPIAAVASAVTTGLLMRFLPPEVLAPAKAAESSCSAGGCGCVSESDKAKTTNVAPSAKTMSPFLQRTMDGVKYAMVDIFDDIALWLMVGLVLAAVTTTWVPPETLGVYGSGIGAMVVMVVVGIPMYICATASTPVAASLLLAGVSPGAVMVFMLAGPATNIATLGVVRGEMGNRAVALYLTGIIGTAIVAGLITDAAADAMNINMAAQLGGEGEIVPAWLAVASAAVLAVLVLRPLLGRVRGLFVRFLSLTAEKA